MPYCPSLALSPLQAPEGTSQPSAPIDSKAASWSKCVVNHQETLMALQSQDSPIYIGLFRILSQVVPGCSYSESMTSLAHVSCVIQVRSLSIRVHQHLRSSIPPITVILNKNSQEAHCFISNHKLYLLHQLIEFISSFAHQPSCLHNIVCLTLY